LLLEEFLARESMAKRLDLPLGAPDRGAAGRVLVHGHCHQKAVGGMKPLRKVLKLIPGLDFALLDTGCCGMAGTFGLEREHALLSGRMAALDLLPQWEIVIGLEIHAQLATASKIFSGAATRYGAEPNTQASLVDLGYPGVLPVLNAAAVSMAVKFGLATGCTIAPRSVFARKNYFYPDLPKGYQISQYELPIVHGGSIDIVLEDGTVKRIGITRAHLEEDAGKSLHEDFHGLSGIDLNRAGTPLLEIVSEPDLRSATEAGAYMRRIHTLVRYLGISDGNMQEGSFRCDANAPVRRRQGRDPLHAQQGRGERLPLLPGPGPAAGGARPGLYRRRHLRDNLPELPDRQARPLHEGSSWASPPTTPGLLTRPACEMAELLRGRSRSACGDAKQAANWVHRRRSPAPLNKRGPGRSQDSPVSAAQLARAGRAGPWTTPSTARSAKQVFQAHVERPGPDRGSR
jgi:hypothetical protein